MIKYTVRCAEGHLFEDWFASMADFDDRAAAGDVACPDCGNTQVAKAIMAPRVAKAQAAAPAPACAAPGPGCGGGMCPMAGPGR